MSCIQGFLMLWVKGVNTPQSYTSPYIYIIYIYYVHLHIAWAHEPLGLGDFYRVWYLPKGLEVAV